MGVDCVPVVQLNPDRHFMKSILSISQRKMEFMDMLKEWLQLRDMDKDRELTRLPETKGRDWCRMDELEEAINKKMRGEL